MNNTDIIQEEKIITPTKVDLLKVWWSIGSRSIFYIVAIIMIISVVGLGFFKSSIANVMKDNKLFSTVAMCIILLIIQTIVTKNILTKRKLKKFYIRLQTPDGQAADQKESLKFAATLAVVSLLAGYLIEFLFNTITSTNIESTNNALLVSLYSFMIFAVNFYITVFFFTKYKKYKVVFFKNK